MPIFLQISRHRRNHSQHALKDVIPPLEQLVSLFLCNTVLFIYFNRINYPQIQQLKATHNTISCLFGSGI